jgi:hypothetical protein
VESTRDALGEVLYRFIKNRSLTPKQAQAQLVMIVRGAAQ